MQAIARNVEEGLRGKGERPLSIDGLEVGRWVLMDYIDVVAHIFLEPVRTFYDLEGLWADAPRVELSDDNRSSKVQIS